jgi:hypothetical protein
MFIKITANGMSKIKAFARIMPRDERAVENTVAFITRKNNFRENSDCFAMAEACFP